jgi:methylthioribose-1-phosphate isomerase
MRDAIHRLAVRGAPAIGVAAGFGVVLGVQHLAATAAEAVRGRARPPRASKPRGRRPRTSPGPCAASSPGSSATRPGAREEGARRRGARQARAILAEDKAICDRLGEVGAELLPATGRADALQRGALATAGGTALAPVYHAVAAGKRISVIADETRPPQGAPDGVGARAGGDRSDPDHGQHGASVLARKKIDAVFVGADRIARNGDVANKIGTYGVAILARHTRSPSTSSPLSTFDRTRPTEPRSRSRSAPPRR